MGEPPVSVIIPVYNTEKFIGECIESILRQTFTHFEVILVNDGSTDQAISIAEKIIGNDPRFVILHQENKGLSSARNLALQKAKGKYIQFVDSDDYVLPNMLEEKYALSEKMNLDLCISTFNVVTSNGKLIKKSGYSSLKNNALNTRRNVLQSCGLEMPTVCTILFRKNLFDDNTFASGRYYEDLELTHKLIYKARLLYYTDVAYYQYRANPVSITKTIAKIKIDDLVYALASIKNYKKGLVMRDESLKKAFVHHYYNLVIIGLMARATLQYATIKGYVDFSKHSINTMDKHIVNIRTLFTQASLSAYQKVQVLFLLKFPSLSYVIYRFMEKILNRKNRKFQ